MISNGAIAIMEETAKRVGFGYREDYPHRGQSPISAGDWKGSSVAVCVFSNPDNAERYIDECIPRLDALGGCLGSQVVPINALDGYTMFIAVISAVDLVAKSEDGDDWE